MQSRFSRYRSSTGEAGGVSTAYLGYQAQTWPGQKYREKPDVWSLVEGHVS